MSNESNTQEFIGELNLVKSRLTLPPEFNLAGKGVFYDLSNQRIDVYSRSYHNPTSVVGADNILPIKYREPFKVHLGVSYGRKYPVRFTLGFEEILGKRVRVYKGTIQL